MLKISNDEQIKRVKAKVRKDTKDMSLAELELYLIESKSFVYGLCKDHPGLRAQLDSYYLSKD